MVAKVGLRQVVDFINRERVKQNLTQNQLAELARLDSGTVSRILQARGTVPTLDSIEKLSQALGYTVTGMLMLAVQSATGFEDVELIEAYQALPAEDRKLVLDFARLLAKRVPGEPQSEKA